MAGAPDRAIVFIDGNNWYHCLKEASVADKFRLDYKKISEKLLGPRNWIGTRYYIGRVDSRQAATVYADQRRFINALEKTDPRITVHLGRIEPRVVESEAASELLQYVHGLKMKIDTRVFTELVALTKRHEQALVWVEKAVDVQLAGRHGCDGRPRRIRRRLSSLSGWGFYRCGGTRANPWQESLRGMPRTRRSACQGSEQFHSPFGWMV